MAYSRRLSFFDQSSVDVTTREGGLFSPLRGAKPTCYTAGRGFLWIGDSEGTLHRFNRSLQTASFKGHNSDVRHAFQLKNLDILLTIGVDDNGEQLKIWNISKWTNKPTPLCSRCRNVSPASQPTSSVTCIFVHESLQFMVLGYSDGQVQLFRGNLIRDRNCKRYMLHTFNSPVTDVALDLRFTDASDPGTIVVFANSDQCIMSFVLGKRDDTISKTVLDRFGAAPNCSVLVKANADCFQYAVARSDAVYFYNWDGRGPCLATDGTKLALTVFRQYLVIVKQQSSTSHLPENGISTDPVCVAIHDQQNKFIAGEFLVHGFQTMFIEWDGIYIICTDSNADLQNKLLCLSEKCPQAKLEMLFSKKNFQLAVDIAKCQHMSKEQLAQIHWRYADHLYKQKEYDAAIKEYVKTVGILEVSFVIQRFLEGGHIAQLAHYLEALNTANLASADHLILLLNCYARLQDQTRLSKFVQAPINPQLNVTSALQMLRQFNFPQIAFELARSAGRRADQVCILIEDLDDSRRALDSIAEFPFDDALQAICSYGHLLISRMPTETLQLLDKLCSHSDASRINVHHFLKIFINNPSALTQFLERYIATSHNSMKVTGVVDALLELALYEWSQLESEKVTSSGAVRSKEEVSALILNLLVDEKLPYDEKKALTLCHRRGFFQACVLLWEKLKLYDLLIKHYMDLNKPNDVLHVCQRFGQEMPKLWLHALHFFASKPECPDELEKVISEIDGQNLASPMAVLHILSDTDEEHSCQVGTIKDYLLRHLETEANHIAALQEEVQELRAETMRNREVVRALNSQVKVFQQQKCALCHQSLEPPSVHFLCDHSYHTLCFENYAYGDQQCPECAPKNKKLLAETLSASSLASAGLRPEQVFDKLHAALNPDSPIIGSHDLARHIGGRILAGIPSDSSQSPSASDRTPSPGILPVPAVIRDTASVAASTHSELVEIPAETGLEYRIYSKVQEPPESTSMGYHSVEFSAPTTLASNPFDEPKPKAEYSLNPFEEPKPKAEHSLNPFEEPGQGSTGDPGLGPSLQSYNPFDE